MMGTASARYNLVFFISHCFFFNVRTICFIGIILSPNPSEPELSYTLVGMTVNEALWLLKEDKLPFSAIMAYINDMLGGGGSAL